MRFAILGSRGYPSTYGGYETLVRHLAPYMIGAGHDVTVYCGRDTEARDAGRSTASAASLRRGSRPNRSRRFVWHDVDHGRERAPI